MPTAVLWPAHRCPWLTRAAAAARIVVLPDAFGPWINPRQPANASPRATVVVSSGGSSRRVSKLTTSGADVSTAPSVGSRHIPVRSSSLPRITVAIERTMRSLIAQTTAIRSSTASCCHSGASLTLCRMRILPSRSAALSDAIQVWTRSGTPLGRGDDSSGVAAPQAARSSSLGEP